MPTVQINVTFNGISAESRDEFAKWAEEVGALSREEPNTLAYASYLSADGQTGVLREIYPDSAGFLEHFGRITHAVGPMIACAESFTVEIFGDASDEVMQLMGQFNPRLYRTISEK